MARGNRLKPVDRISNIQAGISGEYFVAAELSRRGFTCSVTLKNTKGIDILVSNIDCSKMVGVQVKTKQNFGKRQSWLLNEKDEQVMQNNIIYVFVNLDTLGPPSYYIVPSEIVAKYIAESHVHYLKTPGQKGKKHKDTSMRAFVADDDEYHNKWDIFNDVLS